MKQESMPIVEALQQHAEKKPVSFHVPGHKNGFVMPIAGNSFFSSVLPFDQTELSGLDDLHEAEGVIASSQELAASLYGASATLFLVGGSSAGNLAMILAAFAEGDMVLVQRDAHKSIINGLRLARVRPVFLFPDYENDTLLSKGLSKEKVEAAFIRYPQAKGLILTTPTYYGWTPPLAPLIQTAHHHGAVVLADEAHGAHFTASPFFPPSALEEGADVVVQSAHKTLPALTMSAFLHQGRESRVPLEALKQAASMVQSSSPSYPLLASLDMARKYLYDIKQNKGDLAEHVQRIRKQVARASDLEIVDAPAGITADPLKCIIRVPEGYSGWMLQRYLEKEGIYVELADHQHVLLMLPLSMEALPVFTYEKLDKAVRQMKAEEQPDKQGTLPPFLDFGTVALEEKMKLFHVKQKRVSVKEAEGSMTAADIIPYPPGIPLFLKGEELKGERYAFLCQWLEMGGRSQGVVQASPEDWQISIMLKDGE